MQKAAVMVTGGSGFIGQQVVRRFAETSRTVVAVYHHKLPESLENVYPVCADISSPELMAAPLRGVDTVVHLAWEGGLAGPQQPINFEPAAIETMTKNLQMTRHILTAMERAGTPRIIFVSALGADRSASVPFLREKYFAEALVLNSKVPEKVILRTSVVWGGQGPNDRFLRSIIRVMKYPIYPLPKKQGGLAPTHVRDLAQVIVTASSHPMAGQASILDLTGGENYQLNEVFKIVSESYVKRTRIPLKGFLGESLLPLLERDPRSEPKSPKLHQFLAIGGAGDATTRKANPLAAVVPRKLATFKDKILD